MKFKYRDLWNNKINTNWNTNYIMKGVSGSKTLGKLVIGKITDKTNSDSSSKWIEKE